MLHEQWISTSSTALLGGAGTTSWGTAAGCAQQESRALTEPDPAQTPAETQAHRAGGGWGSPGALFHHKIVCGGVLGTGWVHTEGTSPATVAQDSCGASPSGMACAPNTGPHGRLPHVCQGRGYRALIVTCLGTAELRARQALCSMWASHRDSEVSILGWDGSGGLSPLPGEMEETPLGVCWGPRAMRHPQRWALC